MQRRTTQSESGIILLTVLFMVVLVLIALAVAAPRIAADIQRDREAELIHRGEQYKRAIKLYYKKFGRYPTSIDQLENSNNMRFLRKRYVDPMTGKADWKIIHFGEAHVKAMGFFGQPIQNGGLSTTAGGSVLGGTPGLGSVSGGTTGGLFGSTSSTSTSSTGTDSSTNGGTTGTTGSTGTSGTGSSSPFGSSTGTSAFGSGQTLGGAPMVGVVSKSTKPSIMEYKKQKHYNEWEFVYDPVEDMMSSVSLFGGGSSNLNGPGSSGTSGTTGNGFSNPSTGSSPFSSSPSSGSTPTTPTSNPNTPQ